MGLKGKLIALMEVKCGGHSIHNTFHTNSHHIRHKSPRLIKHFEIHEGELGKTGTIISWKYIEDGKEKFAKEVIEVNDPQKKSITFQVIDGDLLELYNSISINVFGEHHWTTLTLVYEKKTEDTPEPLTLLKFFLDLIKDIEGHLLKE